MAKPSAPEYVCRPRVRGYRPLPVVAVCDGAALSETGEITSEEELLATLPGGDSLIIVSNRVAVIVADLQEQYPDGFQYRAQMKTDKLRVNPTVATFPIQWFGWRSSSPEHGGTYRSKHIPLDPVVFYNSAHGLRDVFPTTARGLLDWALLLRQFCADNNMPFKNTCGAMGAQFLRDPRFYPRARRKVPMAINERAREHLPGNHYQLVNFSPHANERTARTYTVDYLDQRKAHHYHAAKTEFPSCNSLFAAGSFLKLDADSNCVGSLALYGLHCVLLRPPVRSQKYTPYPNETGRPFLAFVYSNEVEFLTDFGYVIERVIASWGSTERDEGINRYGEWVQTQEAHPATKPVYLAAYGALASKPRVPGGIYHAGKGEPVRLPTGGRLLHGYLCENTHGRKLEPAVANVIHRGMIEAACRAESLGLAHMLQSYRYRPLQIFADSVFVEAEDRPLPVLPEPWTNKGRLTEYHPVGSNGFASRELTKVPGMPNKKETLTARRGYRKVRERETYRII